MNAQFWQIVVGNAPIDIRCPIDNGLINMIEEGQIIFDLHGFQISPTAECMWLQKSYPINELLKNCKQPDVDHFPVVKGNYEPCLIHMEANDNFNSVYMTSVYKYLAKIMRNVMTKQVVFVKAHIEY